MFLHFTDLNRDFRGWYGRDGTQHGEGYFLALWSDKDDRLFAAVRKARLSSCGPWLMGSLRLAGAAVTLSGSYGGDGLPMDYERLTEAQRALLTPVPDDLAKVYWAGGGWNSAGKEAPAMCKWAVENLKVLTRTRPAT